MQKDRTYRDKKYLDYVRSLSCLICNKEASPHHIITGGIGMKCSDLFTIPLCYQHHHECHTKGKDTFCSHYVINPWEEVAKTIEGYLRGIENG
mgnify:CR=1 FL=1